MGLEIAIQFLRSDWNIEYLFPFVREGNSLFYCEIIIIFSSLKYYIFPRLREIFFERAFGPCFVCRIWSDLTFVVVEIAHCPGFALIWDWVCLDVCGLYWRGFWLVFWLPNCCFLAFRSSCSIGIPFRLKEWIVFSGRFRTPGSFRFFSFRLEDSKIFFPR